jgi:hypothetical protein
MHGYNTSTFNTISSGNALKGDMSLILEYYATEDMLADALTKGLARDRHWKLLGEMGLQKCNIIKEK